MFIFTVKNQIEIKSISKFKVFETELFDHHATSDIQEK